MRDRSEPTIGGVQTKRACLVAEASCSTVADADSRIARPRFGDCAHKKSESQIEIDLHSDSIPWGMPK